MSWLSRLLPHRKIPSDIDIIDEVLELRAFTVKKGEESSASLHMGESKPLYAISSHWAEVIGEVTIDLWEIEDSSP
ncbi:MAG: hypothetical protein WD401_05745 [Thermomicrobiaceae bacterium]